MIVYSSVFVILAMYFLRCTVLLSPLTASTVKRFGSSAAVVKCAIKIKWLNFHVNVSNGRRPAMLISNSIFLSQSTGLLWHIQTLMISFYSAKHALLVKKTCALKCKKTEGLRFVSNRNKSMWEKIKGKDTYWLFRVKRGEGVEKGWQTLWAGEGDGEESSPWCPECHSPGHSC